MTCKAAIAFFQYSVLANFYWLLVEGLYLQTLLLLTFTCDRSYTWGYVLIGWGGRGDTPDIPGTSTGRNHLGVAGSETHLARGPQPEVPRAAPSAAPPQHVPAWPRWAPTRSCQPLELLGQRGLIQDRSSLLPAPSRGWEHPCQVLGVV